MHISKPVASVRILLNCVLTIDIYTAKTVMVKHELNSKRINRKRYAVNCYSTNLCAIDCISYWIKRISIVDCS